MVDSQNRPRRGYSARAQDSPDSKPYLGARQPAPNDGLKISFDDPLDRTLLPASRSGQRSPASSPWESGYPSAASSPNKVAISERSPGGGLPERERQTLCGSTVTERSARALLPFLVNWANFHCSDLDLTPRLTSDSTAEELSEAFKNGVALCKLVECILPDLAKKDKPYSGGGLNQKAKVKNPSMTNLERALSIAWRRGVYSKNMCSALEFWDCRVPRVLRCLSELFHSIEMREVLKNIKDTMRGMNVILATIGRPLSPQTLEDPVGPGSHFISDFADGTRIMILLIYYGSASSQDIGMMLGSPQELQLIEENGAVLEQALREAKFPVLLSPVEWSKPLDIESLIFQIDLIWRGHRFWETDEWNGLMYSMPAKKGKALEGLTFKLDEPVQLLQVGDRRSTLHHLLDDEKKAPVRRALSPTKEAEDMESRPQWSWTQMPTGLERPLWKDGDDPLDLEALREFKSDLFGNFASLEVAFESFDTQKTGSLTLSEFQWGCRAIAHEGNSKRVFANLDIDSVGRISVAAFNELNSLPGSGMGDSYRGLGDETSRQTWAMRDFASKVNYFYGTLAEGFLESDSSGSGWMSHADLELLVSHVGLSLSDDEAKVIIRTLDRDSSGRITQSEFCLLEDLIVGGSENVTIQTPQPMLWEEGGDPADLVLLREFADLLHEHFSNPQEAFDAFAVSGTGRLNISQFLRSATAIGFTGDAKKLFVIMDVARGGFISNEEFWSLDRLPQSAPAVPDKSKVFFIGTTADVPRKSATIELILDGAKGEKEWPPTPVMEAADGETRLPGSAEELEWFLQEDARRIQELEDNGQADVADKSRDAALEAIKAVQAESGTPVSLGQPTKIAQIQGTTSLDVRILMPDALQQRMWLQTAVVDRTGKGSAAADDAVFVVELRQQQRRGRASSVIAHIDLSRITSITQTGPGGFAEPSADLSFIISFERRALIGSGPKIAKGAPLSPSEARNNRLLATGPAEAIPEDFESFQYSKFFQSDDNGATWLLHVIVGPSTWRRRLGICFFDELRILIHFMTENITSAATSLGAAAGAAVGAAGRRRSF